MDAHQAVELAKDVYAILAPYLPALATGAATAFGKKVPEVITALYSKIADRLLAKPSSAEALNDVLRTPSDEEVQSAFRVQLRKALAEDNRFCSDVAGLVRAASQHVQQTGQGNVSTQGQSIINSPGAMQAGRDIHINTERQIDSTAAAIIAQALGVHPCPVSVGVLGMGGEPARLADEIYQLVRRQPNVDAKGVYHGLGQGTFTGVQVRYSPQNTPYAVVEAMLRAFAQTGIVAVDGPDPAQPPGSIYVYVGFKPD